MSQLRITFTALPFILLTLISSAHAGGDSYSVPPEKVHEAIYVANILSKSRNDPTLIPTLAFFVETYTKNSNLEPGELGTTLYDAQQALKNRTDVGQSDFEVFDSLLEIFGSGSIVGAAANSVFDLIAPGINKQFERDASILEANQRLEDWNMSRSDIARQIAEKFYLTQKNNPLARGSASINFGPMLNALYSDSADTIRHNNSEIDQPFLDGIRSDNSLVVSYSQLFGLVGKNHDEVMELINQDRALLQDIDAKQDVLIDWVKNEAAKREAEARAEAQAREHKFRLDAANSTVYLLSTLIGLQNAKLGREIAQAGGAAIQLAEGISKFSKAAAAIDTSTNLRAAMGSAILAGNVVGVAMQVFSMFAKTGPSPDQVISQQLRQISQQISQLRQEMHSRFDRVDAALNKIYDEIERRFTRVDWEVGRLRDDVNDIQIGLFGLQGDLNKLQANLYTFLNDGAHREIKEAINGYLGFEERTGIPMSYSPDYIDAENVFQTWATVFSTEPLSAGPGARDYSPRGVYDELSNYPLAFNINYLAQYPQQVLGLAPLSPFRLANPIDLSTSTEAWLRLAKENPEHAHRIAPYRLEEINARALNLRSAIQNISDEKLFVELLARYGEKVNLVVDAINAIEKRYLELPTYPKLINMWDEPRQSIRYEPSIPPLDMADGTPLRLSPPPGLEWPAPSLPAAYLGLGKLDMRITGIRILDQTTVRRLSSQLRNNCSVAKFSEETTGTISVDLEQRYDGQQIFWRTLKVENAPLAMALVGSAVESCQCGASDCPYWGACGCMRDFGQAVLISKRETNLPQYVMSNWEVGRNMKSLFPASSVDIPPTETQITFRTGILDGMTKAVDSKLQQLRGSFYAQIPQELAQSSQLAFAARELGGAQRAIERMIALGLSLSLEQNDFLRALLYGSERLPDATGIAELYENAIAQISQDPAPGKLEFGAVANERIAALAEVLANIFARIGAGDFSESNRVVETAIRKINVSGLIQVEPPKPRLRRGDVNGDRRIDITDVIYLLRFLFLGEPSELECPKRADVNADNVLNISDPVGELSFLFLDGAPPVPMSSEASCELGA